MKKELLHFSNNDFSQFNEKHFRLGSYGIGHYFYLKADDGNLPLKYLYKCYGHIGRNLNNVSPRKWNHFIKALEKELKTSFQPLKAREGSSFEVKNFYKFACVAYEGNQEKCNWSKFLKILRLTTGCNCLVVDDIAVMFNYHDIKIIKKEEVLKNE